MCFKQTIFYKKIFINNMNINKIESYNKISSLNNLNPPRQNFNEDIADHTVLAVNRQIKNLLILEIPYLKNLMILQKKNMQIYLTCKYLKDWKNIFSN